VQARAIRALADDSNPEITETLLARFGALTPDVRKAAIEVLLAGESRTLALLEVAARGDASLIDLEPARRDVLLAHKNASIRRLAQELFANTAGRARQAVVAEYQAALKLAADAQRGAQVFEKTCSVCHQLAGKGYAVGPNLASSPSRDPAAMLAHVLDPNQYVLPNYIQYVLLDKRGRTFTGMLVAQTATSVMLKKDKDETVTVLRNEIDELSATGKSLMPEGLEKEISPQDMADLLAWLQQAAASAPAPGTPGDRHAERDFGTLPGLIEPKRGGK
jgi:putative heme-binding domain-containing protein